MANVAEAIERIETIVMIEKATKAVCATGQLSRATRTRQAKTNEKKKEKCSKECVPAAARLTEMWLRKARTDAQKAKTTGSLAISAKTAVLNEQTPKSTRWAAVSVWMAKMNENVDMEMELKVKVKVKEKRKMKEKKVNCLPLLDEKERQVLKVLHRDHPQTSLSLLPLTHSAESSSCFCWLCWLSLLSWLC